jgi:hypothetical protein
VSEFLQMCKALRDAQTEADLDPLIARFERSANAGLLTKAEARDLARAIGWRLDPPLWTAAPDPEPPTLAAEQTAAVELIQELLAEARRKRSEEQGQ